VTVSIGAVVTDPISRLTKSEPPSAVRHLAALLAVVVVAAVLELSVLGLDHGTHLLVVLTLVIGIALLFGPGPAATGLAAGGALAGAVSIVTVHDVLHTPHAYVQLLTYLLAGGTIILLVATVVRSRCQAATRPFPGPAARPVAVTINAPGPGPFEPLTPREIEVLRLAATGIPVDEMAALLFVSPNTVKTHLTHVYAKLGVRGRAEAVRVALHCGCLTPGDICPHMLAREADESPVSVTTLRSEPVTID
jgi:DNA-binding CsgD family transcriptional regulator